MSEQPFFLEPEVKPLSEQLAGLLQMGAAVDGAAALSPSLLSIAISLKRIADRLDINSDVTAEGGRELFGEFRVSDGRA